MDFGGDHSHFAQYQLPRSRRISLRAKTRLQASKPAYLHSNFCSLRLAFLVSCVRFVYFYLVPLFAAPQVSYTMSAAASTFMRALGGARSSKKTRTGEASVSQVSLVTSESTGNAGAVSGSVSGVPLNAQQPRSFAQAVGGGAVKRSGPALPAFPRPSLRRGVPLLKHPLYDSMERPAPSTPAPNMLYVDLRASSLTAEEALEAAFPQLGTHVLGFQLFAAQKTLGLVFASAESRNHHLDKAIGDTGLTMYAAPSAPANLLKLTLLGVPFWDAAGVQAALSKALAPVGELVFLAPMVTASGWMSDQWHATIARPADSTTLPPEKIELLGQDVIVDVPGTRRYCRHCAASTHILPSCRQGQRQRSRQNQLAKDQAAADAARQQLHQHQQTQQQQQPHRTAPPPPPPRQTDPPRRDIPEDWEHEVEDMETTVPDNTSAEEKFRQATFVVTSVAADPTSFPEEVAIAARNYLAAAGAGGSCQ
jgi:hypothetical protein